MLQEAEASLSSGWLPSLGGINAVMLGNVFKGKLFLCVEQPVKANNGPCVGEVLCQSRTPAIGTPHVS